MVNPLQDDFVGLSSFRVAGISPPSSSSPLSPPKKKYNAVVVHRGAQLLSLIPLFLLMVAQLLFVAVINADDDGKRGRGTCVSSTVPFLFS